jgi:Fe-S-cluster-containing hydrogenase component 2
MDAIATDQDVWQVLEKRCIGCGLCVGRCPADAISLVDLPDRREPPATVADIREQIAAERGIR